jgi:tRNA (cytidine32/uridine32-2'-O)-methyltransferase
MQTECCQRAREAVTSEGYEQTPWEYPLTGDEMRSEVDQSWRNNISFVLVEPEHPGNIAATARVMAVNGLRDLRLVGPPADAQNGAAPWWMAWGAEEIYREATHYDDLQSAVSSAVYIIGATRRKRKRRFITLTPKTAAETLRFEAATGPVALVFGPERTGLHGTHLEICHAITTIPQRTDHPSLNLSHAAAVLAYELTLLTTPTPSSPRRKPAPSASLQALRRHLLSVLEELGPAPERLATDLFRLWMRARPTEGELRLLHRLLQRISTRLTRQAEEYKCTHRSTSNAESAKDESTSDNTFR